MATWKPWTDTERQYLCLHASDGARAIAIRLHRTPGQVRSQAHYLRLSLRPPGETRGRCTQRAPIAVEDPALCPHCGIYYATEPSGICYRCRVKKKLDEYVANHHAALEAAQPYATEYARQKQQISRFNRGIGLEPDE